MELTKAVKERRSVRKYEDKKVPHELIEEIIEAARYSPSWKNSQTVNYVVAESPEVKGKLDTGDYCYGFTYNRAAIVNAPQVEILTYAKGSSGFDADGGFSTAKGEFWEAFDCGIAAQTFCLLAHERGIGAVIQGYFDEQKISELLELPEDMGVGAVIPIGYIAEKNIAPKRREVKDLVSYR
ncbi:MAG: nitroreductase family protein [Firmicutes bacterium]|nr:nitroreductase family protein [Bacillota bacterium]